MTLIWVNSLMNDWRQQKSVSISIQKLCIVYPSRHGFLSQKEKVECEKDNSGSEKKNDRQKGHMAE